jgi:hypothetical protein
MYDVPGGCIGRERRASIGHMHGILCGPEGVRVHETSYSAEETPGPGAYYNGRSGSLTPKGVRVGSAARDTAWLEKGKDRNGARSSSPGPGNYNVSPRKSSQGAKILDKSHSQVVMTPYGLLVSQSERDISPGPGAYASPRALSQRAAAFSKNEQKRRDDWLYSQKAGETGPYSSSLIRSASECASTMYHRSKNGSKDLDASFSQSPGPGSYNRDHYGRALTPRAAFMDTSPRKTPRWDSKEPLAKKERSPSPVTYRANEAFNSTAHGRYPKSPSASMTSPRKSCIDRLVGKGDLMAHDTRSSREFDSPGPGEYQHAQRRTSPWRVQRPMNFRTDRSDKSFSQSELTATRSNESLRSLTPKRDRQSQLPGSPVGSRRSMSPKGDRQSRRSPSPRRMLHADRPQGEMTSSTSSGRAWAFQGDWEDCKDDDTCVSGEHFDKLDAVFSAKLLPGMSTPKQTTAPTLRASLTKVSGHSDPRSRRPSYLKPTFSSKRKADITTSIRQSVSSDFMSTSS